MGASESQRILHQSLLGEAVDCLDEVAVFVWDEGRHYVAVNEQACRLTGLRRDELIGMPVGELSPERASDDIERVQRSPVTRGTSSLTRRDGERVEIEWVTAHARIANLPFMLSAVWAVGTAR